MAMRHRILTRRGEESTEPTVGSRQNSGPSGARERCPFTTTRYDETIASCSRACVHRTLCDDSHFLPCDWSQFRGPTVQKSTTDLVISPELRRTPDTSRPQTELGTSWVSDSAFVNPCKDSRASERVAQPDSASGNARAPLSPAAASLRDIWPALPLIIPPVSAGLRANGGVDVETRQRGGAWRSGWVGDTRSFL